MDLNKNEIACESTSSPPPGGDALMVGSARAQPLLWAIALSVSLVAAAAGCIGSREYPAWRTPKGHPLEQAECAMFDVWAPLSTKSGVGITLMVTGKKAEGCTVKVLSAKLSLNSKTVHGAIPSLDLAKVLPADEVLFYVPFQFNANEAWNHHDRDAQLSVLVEIEGGRRMLRWPLHFGFREKV